LKCGNSQAVTHSEPHKHKTSVFETLIETCQENE
jgi:hypothetical protein